MPAINPWTTSRPLILIHTSYSLRSSPTRSIHLSSIPFCNCCPQPDCRRAVGRRLESSSRRPSNTNGPRICLRGCIVDCGERRVRPGMISDTKNNHSWTLIAFYISSCLSLFKRTQNKVEPRNDFTIGGFLLLPSWKLKEIDMKRQNFDTCYKRISNIRFCSSFSVRHCKNRSYFKQFSILKF